MSYFGEELAKNKSQPGELYEALESLGLRFNKENKISLKTEGTI